MALSSVCVCGAAGFSTGEFCIKRGQVNNMWQMFTVQMLECRSPRETDYRSMYTVCNLMHESALTQVSKPLQTRSKAANMITFISGLILLQLCLHHLHTEFTLQTFTCKCTNKSTEHSHLCRCDIFKRKRREKQTAGEQQNKTQHNTNSSHCLALKT